MGQDLFSTSEGSKAAVTKVCRGESGQANGPAVASEAASSSTGSNQTIWRRRWRWSAPPASRTPNRIIAHSDRVGTAAAAAAGERYTPGDGLTVDALLFPWFWPFPALAGQRHLPRKSFCVTSLPTLGEQHLLPYPARAAEDQLGFKMLLDIK